MSIRIITDSAADFTDEELRRHDVRCVPMQVIFGSQSFTAGRDIAREDLWARLMRGEIGKTSQPSPDAFLTEFEQAQEAGDEVVYIGVSSGISGTIQSASIARSMLENAKIHIVDTLSGTVGQKILALHACSLRDKGRLTGEKIAEEIRALSSRVRLFAVLDTLENLARSGRIPKAAASIGKLAQLKPIGQLTKEGKIEICGKAIGRHRAIDALSKKVSALRIDERFPVLPLYSYLTDNCEAMIKKLRQSGVSIAENDMSELGPTLSLHIGPNAFGLAFVEAD